MEILFKSGIVICLSILSMLAYRAGGMGVEPETNPKWIPKWMRHSWVRDWLCPLFVLGCFYIFASPLSSLGWAGLLISYGLLGGALTTYFDKWFGFDNFWFSGFMCGLAAIPLMLCGISLWLILTRAMVLAICWGAWCAIFGKDTTEEYGRGGFLVATLPLLLI